VENAGMENLGTTVYYHSLLGCFVRTVSGCTVYEWESHTSNSADVCRHATVYIGMEHSGRDYVVMSK